MMQTKVCYKCKQELCLTLFSKNKERKDGINAKCKLCEKKYYEQNKEKISAHNKKYREENKEKYLEYAKIYRKEYYKENKEKVLERHKIYRQENKENKLILCRKRQSQKLKRIPIWLSNEDFWVIEEIYKLRKIRSEATKTEWHVDHIIPLQGKNVSGLHCPDNLQIISSVYNFSKGNKWDWDMQR